MSAQYLEITSRDRQGMGHLASLADFTLVPGAALDAASIIGQPSWSLYCLDDATRRAIFVELPPDIDLATAPFVYLAQHAHAQRLAAMPYATLLQAAQTLPPVVAPILIYIIGRSGSTLLCHVLNELPDVRCLSEPDIATQFVRLRERDGSRDAEIVSLMDATLRVLLKPTPFKAATRHAIKFRSEALQVMDLYQRAFPDAHNLFMYRDATGFVRSFYRLNQQDNPTDQPLSDTLASLSYLHNQDYPHLAGWLPPGTTEISAIQSLTLWWAAVTDLYLKQYYRGMPALAVDYADLTAQREPVLEAIFRYCGLSEQQVAGTLGAFGRDSQAGTPLARADPSQPNALRLSPEQLAEVADVLGRHPVYRDLAFVVPGMLRL